jgi:hypothetical protein
VADRTRAPRRSLCAARGIAPTRLPSPSPVALTPRSPSLAAIFGTPLGPAARALPPPVRLEDRFALPGSPPSAPCAAGELAPASAGTPQAAA